MDDRSLGHILGQAISLMEALNRVDQELENSPIDASAGAGSVQVRMNGLGDVLSLKIDPELVATGDAGLVEQTILAALRQAVAASREYREEQRAKVTGGFKLPEI